MTVRDTRSVVVAAMEEDCLYRSTWNFGLAVTKFDRQTEK